MQVSVLGIDLGKNSCSLVGFDCSATIWMRVLMVIVGVLQRHGKEFEDELEP
jgi:hypothetical protein